MRRALVVLVTFLTAILQPPPSHAQGRRASDVVHVRNFGASGDGVTDDYEAFRAALARVPASGGTLYIASGDYLLSQGLKVERGNIDVECGNNARLIVGGTGLKIFAFRGDLVAGGRMANVRIAGCKFWDPDPLAHVGLEESHGIVLNRVDHATLERLEFLDLGDEAVDVIRSSDVRILNSRVRGGCSAIDVAHAGSLSVNSSTRIQIRGNVIESHANGSAIRVEVHTEGTQSDYVIIADNQIFDAADRNGLGFTSGSGIAVVAAANRATAITILGNQIVNPYRYGIFVNPVFGAVSSALVIQGNTVVGGGHGIENNGSPNHGAIAIAGNSFLGAVVGNVVQDWGNAAATHAGIRIIGSQIAVVANAIAGVPDAPIRQTSNVGPENVVLGNALESAAAAPAREPPAGCRMAATHNDGEVRCRP